MSTAYEDKGRRQVEAHQWDGSPAALARIEVFVPGQVYRTADELRLGGKRGKVVPLYFWLVRPLAGGEVRLVKPDEFVAKYKPTAR